VVDIALLGPPGVIHDGQPAKVTGRQQALMAALALRARTTVPTDRLVDVVWGAGALPADHANALQQRVSALRRIVDPERTGSVLLQQHHGYCLQVDDARIDARVFAQLADRGRAQLAAGDPDAAEQTLTRALGLWRGAALEGFDDEPWAAGEARGLEEQRLAAVEDRIEAVMALGRPSEVIGDLTDLLEAHPLRERLCGQLMLALYQVGRQAEALDRYERTRRLLADELGVDPGPQLQEVHAVVLRQAVELAPAARRRPRASGNLPAPRTSVVGRDASLEQVGRLLDTARLLTLTGPGGAGKTTLALEVARRREPPAHGTWLVELAPLSTVEAVPAAVADALGLSTGGLGSRDVDTEHLLDTLADQERLVVLDNCEHLLDVVALLTERLLTGAAGLRVLATSREPLQLAGEVVWSVPGLGVPEEDAGDATQVATAPAVQLLVDRTRAHSPDFVVDDGNAAAAAQVVRRLDGIPLAIELAAARLRVLGLTELAAGLDDRFRLLAGRGRTAPSRQRTLRAALDWSWDLLDDRLRHSWVALAVPRVPMDLGLAGALLAAAGVTDDPLEIVTDLVDRSLLTADPAAEPTRYRMLESLRDYGEERLDEQPWSEAVRDRHAEAVHDALLACHTAATPATFGVDLDGLTAWLDDARAALAWAHQRDDRRLGQRLTGLLGWVWLLRGHSDEGVAWLDAFLGGPEALDASRDDPQALLWALALRAGRAVALDARYRTVALASASTPADRVVAGAFGAIHQANTGQVDDAMTALAACSDEAERVGGWPLGFVRLMHAQLTRLTGRRDEARMAAEAALDLLTAAGADWGRLYALAVLIDDHALHGDYARARDLGLDALALARRQRLPELEVSMLVQVAFAAHELGEPATAQRRVDEALELAPAGGRLAVGGAHVAAGALARRRDELATARQHLDHGRRALEGTRAVLTLAWAGVERAHVRALTGAPDAAAADAAAAVGIARQVGDPHALAVALEALAAAHANEHPERAATLLATGAAIRAASQTPAPPPEQRDIDRVAGRVRARLGDAVYHERWDTAFAHASAEPEQVLTEGDSRSRLGGHPDGRCGPDVNSVPLVAVETDADMGQLIAGRRFYDLMYRVGAPWDAVGVRPELRRLLDGGAVGVSRHPRADPRAVDLGCGTGANVVFLAERGFRATGLDFSTVALRKARRRAADAGVSEPLPVHRGRPHRRRTANQNGPFDLLLDFGSIDDLAPSARPAAARLVARLARPGHEVPVLVLLRPSPGSAPDQLRRPVEAGTRDRAGRGDDLFGADFDIEPFVDTGLPNTACFLLTRRAPNPAIPEGAPRDHHPSPARTPAISRTRRIGFVVLAPLLALFTGVVMGGLPAFVPPSRRPGRRDPPDPLPALGRVHGGPDRRAVGLVGGPAQVAAAQQAASSSRRSWSLLRRPDVRPVGGDVPGADRAAAVLHPRPRRAVPARPRVQRTAGLCWQQRSRSRRCGTPGRRSRSTSPRRCPIRTGGRPRPTTSAAPRS
jgi:predicted ATPase/DNA-binding SARP family transcriptional activator/SAM-dependent methyltransferase